MGGHAESRGLRGERKPEGIFRSILYEILKRATEANSLAAARLLRGRQSGIDGRVKTIIWGTVCGMGSSQCHSQTSIAFRWRIVSYICTSSNVLLLWLYGLCSLRYPSIQVVQLNQIVYSIVLSVHWCRPHSPVRSPSLRFDHARRTDGMLLKVHRSTSTQLPLPY